MQHVCEEKLYFDQMKISEWTIYCYIHYKDRYFVLVMIVVIPLTGKGSNNIVFLFQ